MVAAWRRRSHRQQENETGIPGLTACSNRISSQRSCDFRRTRDEAAGAIEQHTRWEGGRHGIVFDEASVEAQDAAYRTLFHDRG
jgi:hypothetical protein